MNSLSISTNKLIILIVMVVVLLPNSWSQSPQKISYQAVIRDANGKLITNQPVGMRISILQGSADGTEVYKEIYNPNRQTNANGLVTLEIGSGLSLAGTFAGINWANGPYFLKTETDPTGGTNYTVVGTSQLLSVPFALYAKTADSIRGGIIETDPLYKKSVAKNIKASDTTRWSNKLSSFTENDPIFYWSVAKNIKASDTTRWGKKLSSFTETDPLFSASVAKNIKASDTTKWNAASRTHYVGESYGGGIVFYIYDGGQHGLIAATADQGTCNWSAGTATNTMAFANGILAGKANTAIIIANQGYGNGTNYAANACNRYYINVNNVIYSDWYLPSVYELYFLNYQRHVVGGFTEGGAYWSSTESNSSYAYYQQFSDGVAWATSYKEGGIHVRAIRSF